MTSGQIETEQSRDPFEIVLDDGRRLFTTRTITRCSEPDCKLSCTLENGQAITTTVRRGWVDLGFHTREEWCQPVDGPAYRCLHIAEMIKKPTTPQRKWWRFWQ